MDKAKLKAFTQLVFDSMAGSMAVGMAYVGTKTGLFETMAGKGPLSLEEVTRRSGLQVRYVEEWLKGMTAARFLDFDPATNRYTLPEEHAYLLASQGSDHYVGGMFWMVPPLLMAASQVARAFREGGGVGYEDADPELYKAIELMNRGFYEERFATEWLDAVPDIVATLKAGGKALDFGCGTGGLSLALAKAFPYSRFAGVDIHGPSIVQARADAQAAGLEGRVSFADQGIESLDPHEAYDLITACDCIHDLVNPAGTLTELRKRLTPRGKLFLVEPKAGDRLEENIHPVGAMLYGMSLFHCMTQSLAHGGAGLGNSLGPARIGALIREAGFHNCESLPIRSQILSFYAVSV
jgi:2-polyprenyl-3-methyl-5-hydroxy-6-metoxy-1,4-benzoquinol methylase